jgi:hypothetical protein
MKVVLLSLLLLCIVEVGKFLWLLIMKFINESMIWLGTVRICNCLNRLLHEVLGCAPAAVFTLEVLCAV